MTTTDSVSAEKDHLLAFNLSKSLCLLADMEQHEQLTKLKAIQSVTKSLVLVSLDSTFTFSFCNFLLGLTHCLWTTLQAV